MSVPRALRAYARDAAGAFRLAPLEVLLGVAVAVSFSVFVREPGEDWWWRVAVPAALVLPLLFGVSVLRARGVLGEGARWAAAAAVLALGAAYALRVFDLDREAEGWRFVALLGAAVLALSLAPAVGTEDGVRRRLAVWHFNFHLLARVVTVVAYGIALYAALAGAVAAVSTLFELDTPDHLYMDLLGAVFFALVPWVVVGGIPELVAGPEGETAHERRGVRLLGRYLYFPVLVVYLGILLAYAAKVLATGEFPKNLLSPIVLLAGLFGFLGSLLVEPLRRHPEHTGVARLIRVLPALLLPLLPLAAWAVWMRRDQYGWTEFRYLRFGLLLALALLALVGTYRLLRRREPLLLSVPAVLGVALLGMAVGPWSAPAVSRASQQERLREGLRRAGVLREGRLVRLAAPEEEEGPADAVTLPREAYERLTGSAAYLFDAHGPEAVEEVLGRDVDDFTGGWQLAAALPLQAGCDPRSGRAVHLRLPDGAPIEVPAGRLHRLERAGSREPPGPGEERELRFQVADSALLVHAPAPDPWTARVDLRPLAAYVAEQWTGCGPPGPSASGLTPERARFALVDGEGRRRGVLVLTWVGFEREGSPERLVVRHASGLVVVTE